MLERCHTVHPELSRRAAEMRSGLQVRQGFSPGSARCLHQMCIRDRKKSSHGSARISWGGVISRRSRRSSSLENSTAVSYTHLSPQKNLPPRNTPDLFCRRFTRQNHRCAAWAVFSFWGSRTLRISDVYKRQAVRSFFGFVLFAHQVVLLLRGQITPPQLILADPCLSLIHI